MIQNKELKSYDLNIKETDNQFIVTIEKKQLNAEYILNLMNWLQFERKKLTLTNEQIQIPQSKI